MAFPPPTRISPADANAITATCLPFEFYTKVGPFFTFTGAGAVEKTYCFLANGNRANGVLWDAWDPVVGAGPTTKWWTHAMKSLDGGLTWTEQDSASGDRPELAEANITSSLLTEGWSTFQALHDTATNTVYIAYWAWPSYHDADQHRIVIARFSLTTDSWLTSLSAYADVNAPFGATTRGVWGSGMPISMVRRESDGHFLLFYNRNDNVAGSPRIGNLYDHSWMSEYTPGGGWSVAIRWAGGPLDAFDYYPYGAVAGSSDRAHSFMFAYSPADGVGPKDYRIYHRSLSSAGVADTLVKLVDTTVLGSMGGRAYPISFPTSRITGSDVELFLTLIWDDNNLGPPTPNYFHSYRFLSKANPVPGDLTDETISSNRLEFTRANGLSSGGVGINNSSQAEAFSWGDFEFLNSWDNALLGAGWVGPTLEYDDIAFQNGAANVGDEAGLIGVFMPLGPTTFWQYDEVFYWQAGAAAPPIPPVVAAGTVGIGGSGSGSGYCYPNNVYDKCMGQLSRDIWKMFQEIPQSRRTPPWVEMPKNGQRYQKVGTLALPADDGVDKLVVTFRVPVGYDGVLITNTSLYDGGGFVDESGDLRWRVRSNLIYLPDLGNVQSTRGRLSRPYRLQGGGYRLYSNDILRLYVNVAPGAGGHLVPAGVIVMAATGWFYPVGEESK